jgi:GT2 family glycosyltransferase
MAATVRPGRYVIRTLDLEAPPSKILVPAEAGGLALDVRRGPRPVGFVMWPMAGGASLAGADAVGRIRAELPAEDLDQPIAAPVRGGPMPSVTVAICTKDHPDLVARCLAALREVRREAGDPPLDVLVVDNASGSDATRQVVAGEPGVRYVREAKVGLNFARNRALAEAWGEILAFIDDDAVVDPYWLNGLRQAWARSPDAGAFTGQTLPFELETPAQILVERIGGFRKGFLPVVFGESSETDWLYPCTTVFGNGCNMAFRVSVIRQLGGFDEALDTGRPLPGGGDLDALHRVVRHGHPLVYEPQMLARHQHRRNMSDLRRQIRRSWGAGCMAYLTKIRDGDRELRWKARKMIYWWIRDLIRRLGPFASRGPQPWSLVLQEFLGAASGLTGTYERSRRRVDRIRRRAGSHA